MDDATPPNPAPAGSSPQKGLIERVTGILLSPKNEWEVIDGEASTVQSIYVPYVVVLAAIGPLAGLLGQQLIGISYGGLTVKMPIGVSVATSIIGYLLGLAAVYIAALVIDALAPTFKGQKNFISALKVAAYAWTPAWLAGIVTVVPSLALLVLVGVVYAFYLLYLGLPRLMKSPQDQSIGYVGVVIFVQFVIMAIVWVVLAQVINAMYTPTITYSPGTVTFG